MNNLTIEVEHLQRGQPRPYAPHVYQSRITLTGKASRDRLSDENMRSLVKLVVHHFREESELTDMDAMSAHFQPKLMRLERISRDLLGDAEHATLGPHREVWMARVEIPYTD